MNMLTSYANTGNRRGTDPTTGTAPKRNLPRSCFWY